MRHRREGAYLEARCPDCGGFAVRERAWIEPMPAVPRRRQRVELWSCYRSSMSQVCHRENWWTVWRGPGVLTGLDRGESAS